MGAMRRDVIKKIVLTILLIGLFVSTTFIKIEWLSTIIAVLALIILFFPEHKRK
jgi:hypothetical protein